MGASQGQISATHIGEWEIFRRDILTPLYEKVRGGDEKNAKTLADIIKICQEGERKALAFQADGNDGDSTLTVAFEE